MSPPIDVTLEVLGRGSDACAIGASSRVCPRAGVRLSTKLGHNTGQESKTGELTLTVRRGFPTLRAFAWGYSSAGRALAWHCRGRRFDPG